MKAVYGEVGEIKELRTTQMCRIAVEVPAESYKAVVAMLHGQKVLLTIAPPIHGPYGVVEPNVVEKKSAPTIGDARLECGIEVTLHEKKEPLGQLAKWAVIRCTETDFQQWIAKRFHVLWRDHFAKCDDYEDVAKSVILAVCDIESRRELDTNENAAKIFHARIRQPYADEQG